MASGAPFPRPAHRTGRADFPHPALGEGFGLARHTELLLLRRRAWRFPRRLTQGKVVAFWAISSCALDASTATPSTKAPSLHRSYPASTVLRASPPSHPTRLVPSRAAGWGSGASSSAGLPVLMLESVLACRRLHPGGTVGSTSRAGLDSGFAIRRRRPSPLRRRVGFRINCFGASMALHLCSGLQVRGSAKQPFPSRASAGRLPSRPSRLLPGAMTISRAGLSPPGLHTLLHGARRS